MSALILEFFLEISLSYSVSYSCCCCFFLCPPTNLFKTIKTEEQFHDQWADNMFNCEVESVCTALYIHRWEQQTVEKPLTAGGCNNPHLYKHRWLLTISGLFWSRTVHLDEKTVWLTCKMTNPTFNVHLEVRKNKINDITTISVKSSKKLSSWIYRLLYKWLKHTECHSVVLTNPHEYLQQMCSGDLDKSSLPNIEAELCGSSLTHSKTLLYESIHVLINRFLLQMCEQLRTNFKKK